CPAYSRYLDC
nr:Chain P, mupain-1 [synthetic construct]